MNIVCIIIPIYIHPCICIFNLTLFPDIHLNPAAPRSSNILRPPSQAALISNTGDGVNAAVTPVCPSYRPVRYNSLARWALITTRSTYYLKTHKILIHDEEAPQFEFQVAEEKGKTTPLPQPLPDFPYECTSLSVNFERIHPSIFFSFSSLRVSHYWLS